MLMRRLRELWCKRMHDSVMWPIDGHYECRVCGCRYEVPWISQSENASRTDLRVFSGMVRLRTGSQAVEIDVDSACSLDICGFESGCVDGVGPATLIRGQG